MIKRILIAILAVLVLLAAVAGFRYALGLVEVRRETQRTDVPPLKDIGATTRWKSCPFTKTPPWRRDTPPVMAFLT